MARHSDALPLSYRRLRDGSDSNRRHAGYVVPPASGSGSTYLTNDWSPTAKHLHLLLRGHRVLRVLRDGSVTVPYSLMASLAGFTTVDTVPAEHIAVTTVCGRHRAPCGARSGIRTRLTMYSRMHSPRTRLQFNGRRQGRDRTTCVTRPFIGKDVVPQAFRSRRLSSTSQRDGFNLGRPSGRRAGGPPQTRPERRTPDPRIRPR